MSTKRPTKRDDVEMVGALLEIAKPRAQPRPDAKERAYASLAMEWSIRVKHRRQSQRRITLGIAASIVVAAFSAWLLSDPADSVAVPSTAQLERVIGRTVMLNGENSPDGPVSGSGYRFLVGDVIATAEDSLVALTWDKRGSLRLNSQTQVTIISASAIRLDFGDVYYDSHVFGAVPTDSAQLDIETPLGVVSHSGSQFMTSITASGVRISVREGDIDVSGERHVLVVRPGDSIDIYVDGSSRRTPISSADPKWVWTAEVAPLLNLDGMSSMQFLAWIGRETGREIQYESPGAREMAKRDKLFGIDKIGPLQALSVINLISSLETEIVGRRILVRARE